MKKNGMKVFSIVAFFLLALSISFTSIAAANVTKSFKDKKKINSTINLFSTQLGVDYMLGSPKADAKVDMNKFMIAVAAHNAVQYKIPVPEIGDVGVYKVKKKNVWKVSKELFGRTPSKCNVPQKRNNGFGYLKKENMYI